jgi:hypothetical protein
MDWLREYPNNLSEARHKLYVIVPKTRSRGHGDNILDGLIRHEDEMSSFAELRHALMQHIFWGEEEFLFPEVEAKGLSGRPESCV